MKFIRYSLIGETISEQDYSNENFSDNPIGEKVRLTMADGSQCIGFWDTTIVDGKLPKKIKIGRYDLNEETGELLSIRDLGEEVLTADIAKVEVISHSNPRWGIPPTNKFKFMKSRNS